MVAIRENAAAYAEHALHRTGEARAERHHPVCERHFVIGLDDEVCVIALYRVVNHAKTAAIADPPQGALEGAHEARPAQSR